MRPSDDQVQPRLFIAGTFCDWKPVAMIFVGDRFLHSFALQANQWESFQLLLEGSWDSTIYPSVADAGPSKEYEMQGPDGHGHGRNWTVDPYPFGANCQVTAFVDVNGDVERVAWNLLEHPVLASASPVIPATQREPNAMVVTFQVVVSGSGTETEVSLPADDAVASAAKLRLFELYGVPVQEQRLLVGTEILEDTQRLEAFDSLANDGNVALTMVRVPRQLGLVGTDDCNSWLWDLSSGVAIRQLRGHTNSPVCLDVDWTAQRAITGSTDKTLRLWDLETGETLLVLEGHSGLVRCVSLCCASRRALSAGSDKSLFVWDLATGACIQKLEGHKRVVECVVVDWVSQRVVSGSGDGTLWLWNLESGAVALNLCGHEKAVRSLAVDWTSKRILSGGRDSTMRLWSLIDGEIMYVFGGHSVGGTVECISAAWASQRAISGNSDKKLRLWDLASGEILHQLCGHTGPLRCVALDWYNRRALSGGHDGTLRLWDLERNEEIKQLKGHQHDVPLYCLATTPTWGAH